MERNATLDKFTKEQLLEEADCVEQTGEWLHMSLMGYIPDKLRQYAEEYK